MSQVGSLVDGEDQADAPTVEGSRRKVFELSWVAGVVAFTLFRLLVAKETLAQYGLNIWIFGVIDVVTAVPYAVGVARVVGAMVDRQATVATGWLLVAAASFVAPYAYVAAAGRGAAFPAGVYVLLAAVMVIFGANAIWTCVRKVRRGRAVLSTETV